LEQQPPKMRRRVGAQMERMEVAFEVGLAVEEKS
jgi:hypothetical protein